MDMCRKGSARRAEHDDQRPLALRERANARRGRLRADRLHSHLERAAHLPRALRQQLLRALVHEPLALAQRRLPVAARHSARPVHARQHQRRLVCACEHAAERDRVVRVRRAVIGNYHWKSGHQMYPSLSIFVPSLPSFRH